MGGTESPSDWGLNAGWILHYLFEENVSPAEVSAVLSRKIDPSSDNLFLPIDDYLSLFAWAAKRLKAPHLGLDIAQELQAQELGIYGYLLNNSPTVGDLCETAVRYQPIFMRGMGFTILTVAQQFEVRWNIYRPDSAGVRQDIEFSLAGFLIATSLESASVTEDGGMEMLANRLHTTSRTLNRRFSREGTSYHKLREEVIEQAAKQALTESDASITIIAEKLGYSESSAFVRAFKRLTGTTPTAYRSQARQSLV